MPRMVSALLLGVAAWVSSAARFGHGGEALQARGVVFEDRNGNGRREASEPGIPAVAVSNQEEVVLTDGEGRYELPAREESFIFVSQPSGYRVPVGERWLPSFYHLHQPTGTPSSLGLLYPGVEPTGPLPASIDFALLPDPQAERFRALAFSDTQPTDERALKFIREKVVLEARSLGAAFAFVAGDVAFDDLSLYDAYTRAMAGLGIPVWHVPGNHDLNHESPDDRYSLETYKRYFGPPYYSFNHGAVHFVMLDNVEYLGREAGAARGRYRGFLDERQLAWLANDLKHVDRSKLVVLVTHIPFAFMRAGVPGINTMNRERVFALLQDRPHVLLVSGHLHSVSRYYLGPESGWAGATPLTQQLLPAISGSWWMGPWEGGSPVAPQRDGTPNGYVVYTFDGNRYSPRFRAAGRADGQLRVHVEAFPGSPGPGRNDGSNGTNGDNGLWLRVNFFAGCELSRIEAQIDDAPAILLEPVTAEDPWYRRLYARLANEGIAVPAPGRTSHLWETRLPSGLAPGLHRVKLKATDPFGHTFETLERIDITAR